MKKYMGAVFDLVRGHDGPEVGHVTVEHDDWCAYLNQIGECDCEPNVRHGQPTTPAFAYEGLLVPKSN